MKSKGLKRGPHVTAGPAAPRPRPWTIRRPHSAPDSGSGPPSPIIDGPVRGLSVLLGVEPALDRLGHQ